MQTPARVCFVVENLLPAGTELWIVRLIEQLDRSKVEPFLCLLDGDNELSKELEPSRCDVLRLGMERIRSRKGVQSARRFYRYLRTNQIQIVQVHHADPTYFAVPLARLARVKKVLQTKYDVGYWLTKSDVWLHRFYRRLVDLTVANCEACREASMEQEWSPSNGVVVVDNGIPLEDLSRIPDLNMPINDSSFHVGMVGNLRPVKNPAMLVDAAAKLVKQHSDIHFHIAGRGELQHELQCQIENAGIESQFTLHGSVEDVPSFLAKMHIAVLCSQSEGLPHALLEYMAAGRAIAVTAVGGNTELIEHERTGLLVPTGCVDSLVGAINRYVSEPEFANRMGRNARRHVADRYSIELMARRFEDFYSGLVRRESSPNPVARWSTT
jgi:glycosyltransferase involved in cell wall biosynthesis